MDEEKECCSEICVSEPETLENFDEKKYLENMKDKIRTREKYNLLEDLKNKLAKQAEEEVCKELGIEKPTRNRYSLCREEPKKSEVSKEEYEELVAEINRINNRNTQIIAIFTDKKECEKSAKQYLTGNYVEEFLNNEAKIHTLLDRIQSINISISHGEDFVGSKFGKPAMRMTDKC